MGQPDIHLVLRFRCLVFRDRRGVAAAELALIAGFIIFLLVGVFDLGLWVWQRMQLEAALLAGAHYAQVFPGDSAGTQSAVCASLPSGIPCGSGSVNVALARDCGADNPANPDDGTCSPGSPRTLVTLTASYPFSAVASSFNLVMPATIGVSYVIRVQ